MAIRTDTIITRYEAVTISHEQGVDRVKQKQQQLTLMLKDWNEEAKRVEAIHSKAWKSAGLALAGVTGAVIAGKAAFQQYAKESRLSAAAAGIDIAQLDKAAGGLQTRMQLLEFAAKAQSGAFKLNTAQMAEAQAAIRAIVRDGYEQEEVTKKVTEALVKLEADGLKDYGIRVAEAKTDTEKFNAIMDALTGKARTADGAVRTEAEGVEALGVRFTNAGDSIVHSLGRIVVALAPLLEGVAWLADKTAGLVGNVTEFMDFAAGAPGFMGIGASDEELEEYKRKWQQRHGIDPYKGAWELAQDQGVSQKDFTDNLIERDIFAAERDEREARYAAERGPGLNLADAIGTGVAAFRSALYTGGQAAGDALGRSAERNKRNVEAAKKAKEVYDKVWNQAIKDLVESAAPRADAADYEFAPWEREVSAGGWASPATFDAIGAQPDIDMRALDKYGAGGIFDQQAYEKFNAAQSQSKLAEMFGPIEDFNVYATAFQTLSGAVGSAMSAWIDGSKSAGEAFEEFIGQALGGIAVQMAMEALKHGAYAIGSLAFGDIRGAATHGKAAAAFAAGAVVVGAAAKAMHAGTGGGASSSAGGGAAPTYNASAGAGGGTVQQTIVYGPDYTNQSPRMRQLHAKKMFDTARGSAGVVYG